MSLELFGILLWRSKWKQQECTNYISKNFQSFWLYFYYRDGRTFTSPGLTQLQLHLLMLKTFEDQTAHANVGTKAETPPGQFWHTDLNGVIAIVLEVVKSRSRNRIRISSSCPLHDVEINRWKLQSAIWKDEVWVKKKTHNPFLAYA